MTPLKRYLTIPILLACLAALAGDPRDDNPNPEPGKTQAKQMLESVKAAQAAPATSTAPGTNGMVPSPKMWKSPGHESPETNSAVKAAEAPPVVYPAAREPKAIAIILRNVHVIQTGKGNLLIVPERYLSDLTNIYPSTVVSKLALEEP